MKRGAFLGLALFCALALSSPGLAAPHPVSVDDLMRLRWIADVQISPDGERVAYVVSQPSVENNTHEAMLYIVPAAGGTPMRMNYGTRIFNVPRPAPRLRWSPNPPSFRIAVSDRHRAPIRIAGPKSNRRPETRRALSSGR